MKRRKNAVYTGQRTRGSGGRGGRKSRKVVDAFYAALNEKLRPEDEIELIPPEQVNPTHDRQEQLFIVADYCVRKILPEVTSMYRWGDKFTPQLRAVAPVVDEVTAEAAGRAAVAAARAAEAAERAATHDYREAIRVATLAAHSAASATAYAFSSYPNGFAGGPARSLLPYLSRPLRRNRDRSSRASAQAL